MTSFAIALQSLALELCTCLSKEVITKVRISIFARRARQNLMKYHAVDTQQIEKQTQSTCTTHHGPVVLTKLIGQLQTH